MFNKNILTYSMVSQLWNSEHKRISDLFFPLILTQFKKQLDSRVNKSELSTLQHSFLSEYGIKIPILAIQQIISKAKGEYIIDEGEAYKLDLYKSSELLSVKPLTSYKKRVGNLLQAVQTYFVNEYVYDLTHTEIADIISDFLSSYGIHVINKYVRNKDITISEDAKYFIALAEFVINSEEKYIKTFCDIYIGNILCEVLQINSNGDIDNTKLYEDCSVYLDTPLIIPLLGASSPQIVKAYKELLEIIKKSGMKVKTMSHIVQEIQNIINGAHKWIRNSEFDKAKANRLALYFFENQEQISQLDYLKDNLEKEIEEEIGLEIVDFNYIEHKDYLISDSDLRNVIIKIYKENNLNDYFDELRYDLPIEVDVTSIVAINCYRKQIYPQKFENLKHILLTKNWGLVSATKRYSELHNENIKKSVFVDSYICGVLWNTQEKAKLVEFYKSKLISDCINILEPTKKFYKEFYDKLKIYNQKSNISEEEYKFFIAEKEIPRYVYKHCPNDSGCILEGIKEAKLMVKAKIEKPLLEENENQKEKNENLQKQLSESQLTNEKSETEIDILKKELSQLKYERDFDKFYRSNKINIFFKYLYHPLPITDLFIVILTNLLGTYVNPIFYLGNSLLIVTLIYFKATQRTMQSFKNFKTEYVNKAISENRIWV